MIGELNCVETLLHIVQDYSNSTTKQLVSEYSYITLSPPLTATKLIDLRDVWYFFIENFSNFTE